MSGTHTISILPGRAQCANSQRSGFVAAGLTTRFLHLGFRCGFSVCRAPRSFYSQRVVTSRPLSSPSALVRPLGEARREAKTPIVAITGGNL